VGAPAASAEVPEPGGGDPERARSKATPRTSGGQPPAAHTTPPTMSWEAISRSNLREHRSGEGETRSSSVTPDFKDKTECITICMLGSSE
jgi:hypothetical protein